MLQQGTVVEQATLSVVPGTEDDFEAAVRRGLAVLERAAGYRWARLLRQEETSASYVLLVGWDSVESHVPGFTTSALYDEWRDEIGSFLAARPDVVHHTVVADQ